MAAGGAEQRVTDEQLTSWVNSVADGGVRHMLLELGEDLRASRGREAQLWLDIGWWRRNYDGVAAVRDALQQRIDKALAALDGIDNGDHGTAGRDYGRGMAHASRLLRAALAGAGDGG